MEEPINRRAFIEGMISSGLIPAIDVDEILRDTQDLMWDSDFIWYLRAYFGFLTPSSEDFDARCFWKAISIDASGSSRSFR